MCAPLRSDSSLSLQFWIQSGTRSLLSLLDWFHSERQRRRKIWSCLDVFCFFFLDNEMMDQCEGQLPDLISLMIIQSALITASRSHLP